MGERRINPLFNVHDVYTRMKIINPYRFSVGVDTLKDSLISCWELDETSGTTAYDAHGSNDGTISGATVNQTGVTNLTPCYNFNGSGDYVTMGNILSFEYNDSFSFSFWVNFTSTSGLQLIYSKQINGTPYTGYDLFYNASLWQIELRNNNSPAYYTTGRYSHTPSAATWYHIVATYSGTGDATGMKLYIDGSDITQASSNDTLGSRTIINTEPFQISGRASGTVAPFNGKIDQGAVWSRVITQAEVTALYNSGSGLAYSNW